MSNAHLIVNKLLEAPDADAPEPYLDWLGQKVEVGELSKIRFGVYIHLSDADTININATEDGVDVENPAFWDELERNEALIEANALMLLRESGLYLSDEGHDGQGARVASAWIAERADEDRRLALVKAIINWAEGDWPSTTSGTMAYAFGAGTMEKLYANTTDAAKYLDVTIEFSGTDALVEWTRLNLNEAIKGDPDDPDVFLQSYVPRMMGRLLMEFNIIKPHFPDAPTNWYRERVDGMDLFRYNRASEMKEIMRQMKAYNRQRGERAGIDQVTYRYKVPNPQGSSIVRRWLDKIGCPPTIIQWACETNPPIWFWVSVKEFNAYMQMVYPQVKLDPVVEGIDDPSPDLVNQIKPKVVCPRCGAEAELGYGEDKLDTHPTAPIHHDSEVPIERYLHPSDQGIHHFDIKQIYKCQCGERFEGTQPSYTIESVADPDDPEAFVKSYRKTYYKLFYGRKFGEGAFVGVYHSLDDAIAAAKERKLRARARSVWVVEEVHPDATDDNVIAGSEPTGLVYDILKGYVVAEPRRVVIESADLDDPEAFLKRFKPRWKRLAHVKNHHFYFTDEAGRVAVADYSMQNQSDPESADDGLLILDKSKPITTYRWQGERRYSLPTTQYYGGLGSVPRQSSITANKIEFDDVWPKLEALGFQLQVREEDEEADPRAYLDAVTGWIDTFVKAGMTRYDTETHKDQLWKKYEVPGYNYWIYVHLREPKWIIVERTDALYGKNIFRRVFEFPDKDINGMVNAFSVLDRKFTKARTRATDDWPAVDSEIDQLYQQHKRRRDRWLSGKIKEAVDDPEVQRYLDQTSPEACKSCGNDLTKRHTVVRQYIQNNGLVHELSGHYDAKDSGFENDDQPSANLLAVLPVCPTFGDICARCGNDPNIPPQQESLDEPDQYLQGPVYSFDELRSTLENYGLSFPSNGIKPWGRWAVIDGFTYWAVYSKDPDKWLPQSYFREQLEKFCKDMGFTVYHIQLFGEYPEGVTFKLAVPKMQIDPEAYGPQERRLNDPDFENERHVHEIVQRDWLPEGAPDDPDDPAVNVERHTADLDINAVMAKLGFADGRKFGATWDGWIKRVGNKEWRVWPTVNTNIYGVTRMERPAKFVQIGRGRRYGQWSDKGHFTCHVSELEQQLREEGALNPPPVEEALDPDDPGVNVERHMAALDIKKIMADLGFHERWPTWKCADPEYMWFEKFTGGLKWTVIRKSDDEPQMFTVSVYKPRKLHGSPLMDYEEIGGGTFHVGELEAKLRSALPKKDPGYGFQEALDVPDPDAPEPNIERFAQHVEKTEADALESAIANAIREFEIIVDKRGIDNARAADNLVGDLAFKWAETAGYANGSDEFDWLVSALNNKAGEMFPGDWEDYPVQEAKENEQAWPLPGGFKIVRYSDENTLELRTPKGRPIGLIAWRSASDRMDIKYRTVELEHLEVDPRFQNRGLGKALVRQFIKLVPQLYPDARFVVAKTATSQGIVDLLRDIFGPEDKSKDVDTLPVRSPDDWIHTMNRGYARFKLPEALDDPDDPQQFIQHMETDWRKILRQHGFKPQPHSDHLSYALTYPDRVWGANWPVNIYAHHGWNPHPEFEYDHPDPDNPDIDAEDAAYDEWQRNNDEFAAIRQRDIAFPDYIAFQFGREYHRRLEVPTSQLDSFLTRLVAGAKKVVGTETVASVHQGRGLTEMLWEVGKEAAHELKIPVKESVDDTVDPAAYAASTFNVGEMLKRMGYERSTREEIPFEWHKVFHRMPTELDLMVEVKRRGLGGEENEGDVLYDITLYRYPVNDNPNRIWEPIVYRYGRSNLQLERVLKRLEERIKANDLRGIRNEVDESVPIPPEDEPENALPSMDKSLVKAELQRLDFGPKPERGIEWIYQEEMPRFWWNKYEGADGKPHGIYINFVSGQTPEIQTRNYNADAKAWFVKGQEGPLQTPAESPAHLAAIVRDLDSTMKRCAAESTPPEQEYEALKRVIEHHRKWWDDLLDYLVRQDNRLPGRIGPGQPA